MKFSVNFIVVDGLFWHYDILNLNLEQMFFSVIKIFFNKDGSP